MTFVETKARKLNRMLGLRIMNALGMIAWHNKHGEAQQKLRLAHPFTLLWINAMLAYGIFAQGVPETVRDIRYSLKHDTVWF